MQGFELEITYNGRRWIRVASLYPETIDRVEYFKNGGLIYVAYDEPFSLFQKWNWLQDGLEVEEGDEVTAVVHLRNKTVLALGNT